MVALGHTVTASIRLQRCMPLIGCSPALVQLMTSKLAHWLINKDKVQQMAITMLHVLAKTLLLVFVRLCFTYFIFMFCILNKILDYRPQSHLFQNFAPTYISFWRSPCLLVCYGLTIFRGLSWGLHCTPLVSP